MHQWYVPLIYRDNEPNISVNYLESIIISKGLYPNLLIILSSNSMEIVFDSENLNLNLIYLRA